MVPVILAMQHSMYSVFVPKKPKMMLHAQAKLHNLAANKNVKNFYNVVFTNGKLLVSFDVTKINHLELI